MSYRENKALKEAHKGIECFRNGEAFPLSIRKNIYKQLQEKFNIDIKKSILVSWLPEGGDNITCCLINQEGNICYFDINGNVENNSNIEKYSVTELVKEKKYKNMKPWDGLKIAIQIYCSENNLLLDAANNKNNREK